MTKEPNTLEINDIALHLFDRILIFLLLFTWHILFLSDDLSFRLDVCRFLID